MHGQSKFGCLPLEWNIHFNGSLLILQEIKMVQQKIELTFKLTEISENQNRFLCLL